MSSTPSQTIVMLGASQAGKSTVVGHLLHICDTFTNEQVEESTSESEGRGRETTAKWSFLVDRTVQEREQTSSKHTTYHKLQTRKNLFTVIDTPGRSQYFKNTVTGMGSANIGVVVVSAIEEEFQKDLPITKQHISLAFCLGVTNLIVLINKFDDESVGWKNEVYKTVSAKITDEAKSCGYKKAPTILPVSGLLGDNLTKPSSDMSWYKGMTLLSALDDIAPPKRLVDKPFRMSIQEVHSVRGKTVVVGQVGTGTVKLGSKVVVSPSQVVSKVKSIQMYKEEVKSASAGDNVGICLEEVHTSMISTGSILSGESDGSRPVDKFVAQLQIRSASSKTLKVGYTVLMDIHNTHTQCMFHRFLHTLDPKTGKPATVNPTSIKSGDIVWAELVPLSPLCLEPYGDHPAFGRLVLRNGGSLVAVGVVKSVERIGGKGQGNLNCLNEE